MVGNYREIKNELKEKLSSLKSLSERSFFIELGSYVIFIRNLPFFLEIEKLLLKDEKSDYKKIEDLALNVRKEIDDIVKSLVTNLKSKKIPIDHFNDSLFMPIYSKYYKNALELYKMYKTVKSDFVNDKYIESEIWRTVGAILNALNENGHNNIIEPFVTFLKDNNGKELVKLRGLRYTVHVFLNFS